MSTNINFGTKLGISTGTNIILPSTTPSFADTTSFLYDGVDEYQSTSAWSTIDGTGEFTISMWIKLDSIASPTRLISGYTGTGTAVNLYLNVGTDGMIEGWSGGSGVNWSRSLVGAITTGIWYHVILRLHPPGISRYQRQRIFINGEISNGGSNYYGGTIPNGTTLGVGANYNYSHLAYLYPTSGNINEVAIWNTYLSDAQILEIYNGGTANDLRTLPTAPIPTNWYRSESANWLGSYFETADEMGNGAKLISRNNMAEASRVNDVP